MIELDDDGMEDDDGILPRLFEIDYAGGVVAGKKGIDTLGIGGYQVRKDAVWWLVPAVGWHGRTCIYMYVCRWHTTAIHDNTNPTN